MSDTIVIESDDEFTVIELTEQGPAGPSGSSVPATPTTLGGIIASGHFWIAANGTLYLANQTSSGSFGNATHVSHIEVDTQGRVIVANPVLITPDWSNVQNRPSFANVSTSGLYSDLIGTPNLSVYQLSSTNTWANLTGRPNLAAVATSGLYSDLSGTPNLSLYQLLATNTWANLTGKPLLATVATSGLYSDLSGTPNLSLYLTVANAASTYQTIAGMSSYATLTSPALTGTPTAPTAANGTATTQLATTAFVANALTSYVTTANFTFANLGSKPTTLAGYGITDGLTSSTAASTYAPITTTVTLTGTQTLTNKTISNATISGTQTFNNQIIKGPQIQSAGETTASPAISAGTLTLDLSTANVFKVSLNAAITTISITNCPSGVAFAFVLEFTYTGTAYSVIWSPIVFPGGTTPTLTNTSGKRDTFVVLTTNGGTSWTAFISGQNA